jgi:hypothetical protein
MSGSAVFTNASIIGESGEVLVRAIQTAMLRPAAPRSEGERPSSVAIQARAPVRASDRPSPKIAFRSHAVVGSKPHPLALMSKRWIASTLAGASESPGCHDTE